MTISGRKPFGFAITGVNIDRGQPAVVQAPKVYDFTGSRRPEIPESERPHLRPGEKPAGNVLPTPPVLDFTRKG